MGFWGAILSLLKNLVVFVAFFYQKISTPALTPSQIWLSGLVHDRQPTYFAHLEN
jgi:hypothetical protein